MSKLNNMWTWLVEDEQMPDDPSAIGATNATGMPGNTPAIDPNITNQMPPPATPPTDQPQDDITNDPAAPVPMDDPSGVSIEDFDTWKRDFFKLAIKGDVNAMIDSIGKVRDMKLSDKYRKFVEDNIQILLLRQDANIEKMCKEIRKLIKQELDHNNPATSVMQHIATTLDANPLLYNVLIKLNGLYALKSDLHRKFIAALTGCVQTGGGNFKEDLIYSDKELSINFSTRFFSSFEEINIGRWTLQEDDPQQYLSDSEMERMRDGSPEEREVLRNRVVLESISQKFKNRGFLINVVDPQTGVTHFLGWDVAESLKGAYKEGKLVVRKNTTTYKDAMINDDGEIVPLYDLRIMYVRQSAEMDSYMAASEELPFMERRDGMLYLTATVETIQELSSGIGGMFYKEVPYQGNPSDLITLMRCVPSLPELVLRRC